MPALQLDRWNIAIGDGSPLVVMAGLNVLESEGLASCDPPLRQRLSNFRGDKDQPMQGNLASCRSFANLKHFSQKIAEAGETILPVAARAEQELQMRALEKFDIALGVVKAP